MQLQEARRGGRQAGQVCHCKWPAARGRAAPATAIRAEAIAVVNAGVDIEPGDGGGLIVRGQRSRTGVHDERLHAEARLWGGQCRDRWRVGSREYFTHNLVRQPVTSQHAGRGARPRAERHREACSAAAAGGGGGQMQVTVFSDSCWAARWQQHAGFCLVGERVQRSLRRAFAEPPRAKTGQWAGRPRVPE